MAMTDVIKGIEFEVSEKNDIKVLKAKDSDSYVKAVEEAGIDKKVLKQLDEVNEAYLEATIELAKDKAIEQFKDDAKRVEIVVPFGLHKSDIISYDITKEKSFPIPGKNEKVTKPVIKMEIKKTGYKLSKSKIKTLESSIADTLGIK